MEEYSRKKDRKAFTRDAIIGLGEDSFRKNYYPELQEKITNLEQINARNRALLSTIPDVLLVSDLRGVIAPFSLPAQKKNALADEFLGNPDGVVAIPCVRCSVIDL